MGYYNFNFNSFNINFDGFSQIVNLGLFVKTVDKTSNDELITLSEPFLGDLLESVEWVYLATKNIMINDIILHDSLNVNKKYSINEVETNHKSLDANDKVYIKIDFEYTDFKKLNFKYLEIKYTNDNDEECILISDIAIFGNNINVLETNIC